MKKTSRYYFYAATIVLVCVILTGSLFSCAKYIDDPTPADPVNWFGYRQNADDTIAVSNGSLYLSTHQSTSSNSTYVSANKKLQGEFELKIKYSSFVVSGVNDFSDQLFFRFSNDKVKNALVTGYVTNDGIYLQDSTKTGIFKRSINRDGDFYLKRNGTSISSWIRAGSDSLFLTKSNYYGGELTIEMGVLSADNTATHTAVKIEELVLLKGGPVESDTFDENRIDVY